MNVDRPRDGRQVVEDAVLDDRQRAHDRQVRRYRHVRLRERLLEDDALAREAVEVRRAGGRAAVRAEVIRAQRVDGDEDDVRPCRGVARRAIGAAAGGDQRKHDDDEDARHST